MKRNLWCRRAGVEKAHLGPGASGGCHWWGGRWRRSGSRNGWGGRRHWSASRNPRSRPTPHRASCPGEPLQEQWGRQLRDEEPRVEEAAAVARLRGTARTPDPSHAALEEAAFSTPPQLLTSAFLRFGHLQRRPEGRLRETKLWVRVNKIFASDATLPANWTLAPNLLLSVVACTGRVHPPVMKLVICVVSRARPVKQRSWESPATRRHARASAAPWNTMVRAIGSGL